MIEILDSLPEHIQNRITVCNKSGCWLCDGDPSSNGYQRVWYFGKRVMAHILLYQLSTGTKARTRVHDHLCENRACCNPEHIELVTQSTNCKRIYRRRKRA